MGYLPVIAIVTALLLAILGIAGLLLQRNLLISLVSLNYLLLAVVLLFGAFAAIKNDFNGEIFGIFIALAGTVTLTAGTCFLALFFKQHQTLDIEAIDVIKEDI